MNFSIAVRDNNPSGGMISIDNMTITTSSTGPFQVTSQNKEGIEYDRNTNQTISWNIAGTNRNGINTDRVNILISYDNGLSFNKALLKNTRNDGEERITIPKDTFADQCRIKIEPIGNIYYAVNSIPFKINTTIRNEPKIIDGIIDIYPNPNQGRFIIRFGKFASEKEPVTVQVFNVTGQLVWEKSFFAAYETDVSLNTNSNGIYMVRIARNTEIVIKKILIQ